MIRQLIHNLLPVWLIVTMIIRRHSITETKEWVGLTIISLIDNSVVFCLFFFLLKIYKCHSIESNPVLHCFFLCFHSIDFSNQTPPVFIVLYRSVLILSHLAYLFFVTACNCKGLAWILKLPWNREFHNTSLYGTPKKYLGFIANMECRFCHFLLLLNREFPNPHPEGNELGAYTCILSIYGIIKLHFCPFLIWRITYRLTSSIQTIWCPTHFGYGLAFPHRSSAIL